MDLSYRFKGELINIIKGKRSEDTEKKLEALLFSREPLNDRTNVLFSSFLWRFKRPITRAMIRGKLNQGVSLTNNTQPCFTISRAEV